MTSNGIDQSEEFALSNEFLPEDLTKLWDIGNEQNWLKRRNHQDPDSLADLDKFLRMSPSRPSSSDDSFKSATDQNENPFSDSGENTSSHCHMDRRFTFVVDSPLLPSTANISQLSEQTFIENISPPTPYYKSHEVSFSSKTPSPEIYLNKSNRKSSRSNFKTNIRKMTLQLESNSGSPDISDVRLSIKMDNKPSLTPDYAVGSNLTISPNSKDLSDPVLARLYINKSCNNELPLVSNTMDCRYNTHHLRKESHATINAIPADLYHHILMTESASNINKDTLNGLLGNASEVKSSVGDISRNHTERYERSNDIIYEVSGLDHTLSSGNLALENSTLSFVSSCCDETLVAKNESEKSPELNAPKNVQQIECNDSTSAQCYSFIQSLQQVSETDFTSMKSDTSVDAHEKLNHSPEVANTTFVYENYSCCDETLVAHNEDDLSFGRDNVSKSQCSKPNVDRSSEIGLVQQHTREEFDVGNAHTASESITRVSPSLSKVAKSPNTYQRHDSMMFLDSNSNIRPKIILSPPSCHTKRRNEFGLQPATSYRRITHLSPSTSVPDLVAAPLAETRSLSKNTYFSPSLANLSTLPNPARKRLSRIPLPTRTQ